MNVAINPEMEHAMVSLQQLLSADPLIAAPTWFKLRHVATQRINVEYIAPISIKAEELTAFLNYAEKKPRAWSGTISFKSVLNWQVVSIYLKTCLSKVC
ncbi:MAG: hypothetical protein HWD59_02220 [Coxiellaceae bacterium]|nr:MAG: hypothetical protein HWD59_02220 [Coxiellaceae bacterium]